MTSGARTRAESGPVGAGLLLQPTGIAVLQRLGVLDEVTAGAAWVSEVHGTTVEGRRFMDLAYARLGEGVHGLGVHRGALFTALRGAAQRAGAVILPGVEVVRRVDRTLIDAGGARYGPYARIVGAERSGDGAARRCAASCRSAPASTSTAGARCGRLRTRRTFDGRWTSTSTARAGWSASCHRLGAVSVFWSVRLDRIERCARGRGRVFARTCCRWRRSPSVVDGLTSMDQLLSASYRHGLAPALARRDAGPARRRRARAQPAARTGREPRADGRGGAGRRRLAGRLRGGAARRRRASTASGRGR